MEDKLIKKLSARGAVLMCLTIVISIVFSRFDNTTSYANEEYLPVIETTTAPVTETSSEEIKQEYLSEKSEAQKQNKKTIDVSEEYVAIPKYGDMSLSDISITDNYMTRSARIEIHGLESSFFNQNSIIKNLSGNADAKFIDEEHTDKKLAIEITFDKLYMYNLKEDESYFYIELLNPKEVYEKIIVIDPGHGGSACGTIALDGETYEKDINLSIALYLKELLDKENIKVYYTRLKDDKYLLDPRVSLANELNADAFISIHCNGDTISQSYGTEVLYDELSEKTGFNSKSLAQMCLDEIVKVVETRNRGLVFGNSIYIIRNSKVPVALIEVGYMTNQADFAKLKNDNFQKNVATGIYNAIMKMYSQKDQADINNNLDSEVTANE